MYTKAGPASARLQVAVAALVGTLFAGNVAAEGHYVTVAIAVSAQRLDLSQPADAQALYTRLQTAARVACTSGNRVDLEPVGDLQGCVERALGGAIRSAKTPTLTRIYLETHTLQAAASQGIGVPAQVAAQ